MCQTDFWKFTELKTIMKNTLELEELGLTELTSKEIEQTEGGIWQFIAGLVIGGIISDWPGFKQGLKEGLSAN